MKKGVIGAIIAGAVFIFLLFFVIPFRSAKTSNGITTYPIIPILSYTDYHIEAAPAYTGNSNANAESRYIGGHGAGFFGIPLVFDKYYVYEDGHKELFQLLFFRFGEDYEIEKTDKKEMESLTKYLTEKSGSSSIKIFSRNYVRSSRRLNFIFLGVNNLTTVDNVAFALNSYMEEHPESLINRDKPNIEINFNYERIVGSVHLADLSFAQINNGFNYHRTNDDQNVKIDRIVISVSPRFDISEFAKCRVPYRTITVSQAVTFDNTDALMEMKSLEKLYLRPVQSTVEKYDLKEIDYDTYKRYCDLFSAINAKKGFKFAEIEGSFSKWEIEYGKDFAHADAPYPVNEVFKLTLNKDYSITRDEHSEYKNLTWHIECNGVRVLERVADNETTLETKYQWTDGRTGTFTVYLTAYVDGTLQRLSNTIQYTLETPAEIKPGTAVIMKVNGTQVPVKWEDNRSVLELTELAKKGLTISMTIKSGREQSGAIGCMLNRKDSSMSVSAGDIVLFSGSSLVIFYDKSDGLYTKIGKIDLPPEEIKALFSKGDVTVVICRQTG